MASRCRPKMQTMQTMQAHRDLHTFVSTCNQASSCSSTFRLIDDHSLIATLCLILVSVPLLPNAPGIIRLIYKPSEHLKISIFIVRFGVKGIPKEHPVACVGMSISIRVGHDRIKVQYQLFFIVVGIVLVKAGASIRERLN